MSDDPIFMLPMFARDYKITVIDGDFTAEDKRISDHVERLFDAFDADYTYSFERTLVEFVDDLKAEWINKPTVPPIELDDTKVF